MKNILLQYSYNIFKNFKNKTNLYKKFLYFNWEHKSFYYSYIISFYNKIYNILILKKTML